MYLYVIRVSVDPPLYVVGVSASPEDVVDSLRQRFAPLVPELAGQGLIDSRRLLTIEATVHHVLTALRLAKPTRGWFIGDANLADFLNTDRLDAWFTSTTEISNAANGYTLPAPRKAPDPTHRCELRTAKGTRCWRRTLTPCVTCNQMCCGPHQMRIGSDTYCRPCWRDLQRQWDLEDRAKAKAKARADFAEEGPDYAGFEDFNFDPDFKFDPDPTQGESGNS